MERKPAKTGAKTSARTTPASLPVDVLVSIADDHMDQVHEGARGLNVDQVLGMSGVITGSVEPEKLERLRGVKGIAGVECSRTYKINPPDSSVQ